MGCFCFACCPRVGTRMVDSLRTGCFSSNQIIGCSDLFLVFFGILCYFSTKMSTPNANADSKRSKETK